MTSPSAHQLPNLIIAGVNKAGTTSLFHYLAAHPQVCASLEKETCYFLPLLYGKPPAPISEYSSQWTHCKSKLVCRMEATPGYFYGGAAIAQAIHQLTTEAKVIIILKDPVERLLSFYNRKRSTFQLPQEMTLRDYVDRCMQMGADRLPEEKEIDYSGLYLGIYHLHLEEWFRIFGDRLQVLFFDDLKKDTKKFVKDLSRWVGIDPQFYDDYNFEIRNQSQEFKSGFLQRMAVQLNNGGKRFWRQHPQSKQWLMKIYYGINGKPTSKPGSDDETIHWLRNFYRPHNRELRKILLAHNITSIPAWLREPVTDLL